MILGFGAMSEVTLHVYDVTNSMSVRTNSAILGLNRVMRGGIGIGGIFHGAVEVSKITSPIATRRFQIEFNAVLHQKKVGFHV